METKTEEKPAAVISAAEDPKKEPTPEPAKEAKPTQPKPQHKEPLPSPVGIFATLNCADCEGRAMCKATVDAQATCLEVIKLSILREMIWAVKSLREELNANAKALNEILAQNPVTVQRNTKPLQGSVDISGIIWIKDVNSAGETYEKALLKDNEHSESYRWLEEELIRLQKDGKRGKAIGDKWYFLSTNRDFIGRKPKKDFSKRT